MQITAYGRKIIASSTTFTISFNCQKNDTNRFIFFLVKMKNLRSEALDKFPRVSLLIRGF